MLQYKGDTMPKDGYDIILHKKAEKTLYSLGKKDQKRIVSALESLQKNPRRKGAEKLSSNPSYLRRRVGNFRVIYRILEDNQILVVLFIRDRKDAYDGLDQLDSAFVAILDSIADTLAEEIATKGNA